MKKRGWSAEDAEQNGGKVWRKDFILRRIIWWLFISN